LGLEPSLSNVTADELTRWESNLQLLDDLSAEIEANDVETLSSKEHRPLSEPASSVEDTAALGQLREKRPHDSVFFAPRQRRHIWKVIEVIPVFGPVPFDEAGFVGRPVRVGDGSVVLLHSYQPADARRCWAVTACLQRRRCYWRARVYR